MFLYRPLSVVISLSVIPLVHALSAQHPRRQTIPATLPGTWTSKGCVTDNVNGRALTGQTFASDTTMTIESCISFCDSLGSIFAGVEFASQCYCGDNLSGGGGTSTPETDCNMVCTGNSLEPCGGPNRLNLFTNGKTPPPPPAPVTTGLPTGWSYGGCWVDNVNGRIGPVGLGGSSVQTVETCIAACSAQNFTLAGIEFAGKYECFCGNTLVAGGVKGDESTCNMPCAGNPSELCGGPNRLSVYTSTGNVTALPVPVVQTTNLPGQWQYSGCLIEVQGGRMFNNQIIWIGNNTAVACMNQCAAFGFSASGTEFGQECYCGDVTDVAANNGVFAPASDCNTPCPGDPIHLCGSGNRLTTYFWNGIVNNWKTPANIGRYEFFVPGLITPLIATVNVNNKVTFLEKGGTGIPNATGAYELDISLASDFSKAWREMHIKTDVFCSGSVILPDKAGRVLNVGGWSEESTFGVRMYTPNGVPGTNSTNDWEENFLELSLQRGRWYPSAAVLPNGTVVVVGGETGSNAAAQPNLEILPKPVGGDTVVELDWLQRTDPNNLYPFLIVLPSKNLFVGYYNEARILNPATFDTITTLPNMPGAVNDFTAGRTYPLEGTAVPMPQHAPYTDPLEILICGGSTIGAGFALDNCVRSAPESANPTWTIERMPSRRVMPCMVTMPDGTVMILNGAQHGVAGFGLADDPNLTALLYTPTDPIGSRISILNTTIVARLYHSEAALLPDGRVLVSGSDPQTDNPDGTVKFPQEYRVEVYIPPYLNQGFTQPTFNLPVSDWVYGQSYQITNVHLFQGTTSTLRVSLVAATSSTHGNTMGARTIFPAFTCAGTTCTITAPPHSGISPPGWHMLFVLDGPTPSHSSWVRIGGDPAQIGNWPQLPGFTPPGV